VHRIVTVDATRRSRRATNLQTLAGTLAIACEPNGVRPVERPHAHQGEAHGSFNMVENK
jgi:hypothetical protein